MPDMRRLMATCCVMSDESSSRVLMVRTMPCVVEAQPCVVIIIILFDAGNDVLLTQCTNLLFPCRTLSKSGTVAQPSAHSLAATPWWVTSTSATSAAATSWRSKMRV